ncbi:MAG: TonB-dependent receptor domain-containing protein, partial [Bacteroidota bacterium]
MRSITIFFIFLVTTVYASAQQGTLRGTIIDAETGEPLIGASVVVTNTTNGTISDFDGNYTLKLAPGNYSITVSYISYETQTFTDVEVNAGETITLNANLRVATTDLEEVVVTARSRQQTESAMQVMQKKSAIVMDGISAQHISRLGDSDAAGALKRVTGVTVQDGKYVYIRGLSDRYMTITLNGAIIPGLDPNFNTVQMDLFPSNVIENMVVSKTYTPDQPSFTGGLVNIQTKDFPTRLTINASASTGINSQAHFHDDFLTYNTGETDWLGFDDGTREVPEQLKDKALTEPVTVISEPEISYNESKHFNKELDNEYRTAPLNQGYSFSLGNQFDFSNERALGFIAALSYSSKSTYFEGGKNSDLDAANDQVVEYSETLTENMGSQDVIWSALLSSSLKINNNNRIRLTYLRNQNGTSTSRSLAGRTMKSDIYDMEKTSLEYLERSLTAYQMSGKHVVPALNNLSMEWQTSYTHSIQNEPDLRFFINEVITLNEGQDTIYEVRSNRKPERRYRHMWEYNWHSRLDFTAPVNLGDKNLALKFGASYLKKFRNSEDDRYTIEVIGTTPTDAFRVSGHPSDFVLDPNLFGYESQLRGTYYANDLYTNQYYSYEGEDEIPSGYLMADFPLFDKLRLVGGVRYEQTSMYISNQIDTTEFNRASHLKAARNSKADTTFKYLLPAINITYQVNNNMNIRAAYSSSVSRPSFRERAPFDYYEFTTG